MIKALVLTLFWMLLFITKTSTMNKVVQLICRHFVGKYYSFHVSPLVVCLYLDRTVKQLKPPKNIHTTIKPPRQKQQHTTHTTTNNTRTLIVSWPETTLTHTSVCSDLMSSCHTHHLPTGTTFT